MQLNHCDGVLSNHLKYLIRATNISAYSNLYVRSALVDNLLISKSLKKSSETFAYKARADLDIKIDVWRDF